jgi:acyl dehydratase
MEWTPGAELPELKVVPDRYVTVRYAGASGDFNPIHFDDEFARRVGLPGRILHGLWTMAQVARAHTEAAGGPQTLKRLQVQFRGMGVPEQEVVVRSQVSKVDEDGTVHLDCTAWQADAAIIRRGEAEVRPAEDAPGAN